MRLFQKRDLLEMSHLTIYSCFHGIVIAILYQVLMPFESSLDCLWRIPKIPIDASQTVIRL